MNKDKLNPKMHLSVMPAFKKVPLYVVQYSNVWPCEV